MFLKSSGLNAHVQEAVPPERPTRESPQHRPHWGRAFIWGAHSSQCPVSQVTLKATGWEGHSAQWLPHKHGGRAAGAPQALQGLQGPPPGPSQPPRPGRDAGRHQWGDSRHCRGPTEPPPGPSQPPRPGRDAGRHQWGAAGFSPSALSPGLSGHSSHHRALF